LKAFALFLLLASASGAAAGCNPFAVRITTTPVLYQWTSGLEKATALLGSPPTHADTILIGDSLLAFWPKDLAEKQFGDGSVWNFAVGGSRTQHVLWQLENLKATTLDPREVVVLIGTNNLSDQALPACAIVEGIKSVAVRLREIWPDATIRLMGIPPRGSDFHFRDEDRKVVNADVAAWAEAQPGIAYFAVDDVQMTCGRYTAPLAGGSTLASRTNRCANYADDFGHFRRPGYEVIFTALRQAAK
jgi:hypothetical protein